MPGSPGPSMEPVSMDRAQVERDINLRRARAVTLSTVGSGVVATLLLAGVGVWREPDRLWMVLGAVGIVVFVVAQSAAMYAAITPWLAESTRRRSLIAFAAAALLSIPLAGPLVGPAGGPHWATWAFIGASVIGSVPLLRYWRAAGPVLLLTVLVTAGLAIVTDVPVREQITIVVAVGVSMAAWNA